jgi:hypothetical protein
MADKGSKMQTKYPLARSERLLVENVGLETVIYDLNTNDAHALKPLAAAVFMYANGQNSAADIAELAAYRLATPVTTDDVLETVAQLEELGLTEAQPVSVLDSGISRRTALKTFAAVGAGTMLISTVSASAASIGNSTTQTSLGDDQECVLGTTSGTSATVTPGGTGTTQPSGAMVPGQKVSGGTPDSGSVYSDYVFPQPGISSITISGGDLIQTTTGFVTSVSGLNSISGGAWTSKNLPNVTYGEACTYLQYHDSASASGSGKSTFAKNATGLTLTNTTGAILPGMSATGTGLSSGTTVTNYDAATGVVTLSKGASSAESTAVTITFGGTATAYYSEASGGWQCVPCDGVQGYQCCSVVCGPVSSPNVPSLGYTWGSGATVPKAPSPVVNAYQGCGTDSVGADTDCPSPGYPDYTDLGYDGKFCTINGGKPVS